MRGGTGPPGSDGDLVEDPSLVDFPLNLILYMSFRIFTYSSNIWKDNFDRMDSILRDFEES